MMHRAAASALFLVLALLVVSAQSDGFDPEMVALTFHKVSGAPLDTQALAAQSQTAIRASGFDRPDVIAAEQKRLDAQLASMNPAQEFTITIDDTISQYDHTSGQFSVELFNPGHVHSVSSLQPRVSRRLRECGECASDTNAQGAGA